MGDDEHEDLAPRSRTISVPTQYSFGFGETLPLRQRCRGIDGARPAAPMTLHQPDMFYDNSQRVFAMMVARETDVALAPGDSAYDSAALLAEIEAGVSAREIAMRLAVERRRHRYRPSFLIDYLVPADRAQDMHANLEDIYPAWVERHGARKAARIKSMQVGLLIAGTWWEKLLSTVERLFKVVRLSG